jgi:hypothetical protein
MKTNLQKFFDGALDQISQLSVNSLTWLGIIVGHAVFVPTCLALISELTDKTPSIDIVILVQVSLLLSFFRSVASKDTVATVLHALGWFTQAMLLSLIIFK